MPAEKKEIMAHDGDGTEPVVTPMSAPNHGLGGFDARNRATTPRKDRAGSHVPTEKKSERTPVGYFKKNDSKMGEPVAVKSWKKKYL